MEGTNILPDELALALLKKAVARGCDYADVFAEHRPHVSIQLEDNRIEKVVSGTESGIGIRFVLDDRSYYAYTNDFSRSALFGLIETVSRTAHENGEKTLNLKQSQPGVDFTIKSDPRDVAMEKKISLITRANKAARGVSSRIRQVTINYQDKIQNVCVATSEGSIARDERIYTLAVIRVVAAEGDILQTGFEPLGGMTGFELFERDSFEETALRIAKKTVMMLSASKIQGGRMPVVISSDAGGTMIHEAVGHGLEADLAQQGLSVYAKKVGQQIASSLVTVIDDATLPNRRGSFRFDDEGVPSQKTVLVQDGILKRYMYDRLTARKDGVYSTGNGRRESYESRPVPRMTNTLIAPGNDNPEDIIKSVHKGFFVRKMGGGQVNTVTGEFVFEVSEGYMIHNGQVAEPVRGATLIGNGPEVLMSINMVGTDIGFTIGTCGKDAQGVPVADAMPTISIPEMVVGGEAGKG